MDFTKRSAACGGADRSRSGSRPRVRTAALILFVAIGALGGASPQARAEADAEEAAAAVLPEVRVVDSRAARGEESGIGAQTVLTRKELTRPGATLADVLSRQAGADVVRTGGAQSFSSLSLRGTSAEQVAVVLDGIPLNSALGGGVDLSRLPLAQLGRVTILRGATPLSLGVSGMAGALLVDSLAASGAEASARAGFGSFAARSLGAGFSLKRARVDLSFGLDLADAGGAFPYLDDNGTRLTTRDDRRAWRRNNDYSQLNALFKGRVTLGGSWRLRWLDWFFARNQGLPGVGVQESEHTRLTTLENVVALRIDGTLGSPRLRSQTRLDLHLLDMRLRDTRGELGLGPQRTHDVALAPRLNQVFEFDWLPSFRQTVQLGYRFEHFAPRAEALSTSRASGRHTLSLGAESRIRLGAGLFTLVPSARMEVATSEIAGRANESAEALRTRRHREVEGAGRLSLACAPLESLRLDLAFGRGFRLPNLGELFGNQGSVVGNSRLRPERSESVEAGLDFARSYRQGLYVLHVAAHGYLSRIANLIQYMQNAQGLSRPANLDRARLIGVEGELEADLLAHLALTARYGFLHTENDSAVAARSARELPLRAPHKTYVRAELYALSLLPELSRVGVFADHEWRAAHYLDAENLRRVPGASSFGLGFSVALFQERLVLQGSVSNLADARRYDLIGQPLPGRAFYFSAEGRWP